MQPEIGEKRGERRGLGHDVSISPHARLNTPWHAESAWNGFGRFPFGRKTFFGDAVGVAAHLPRAVLQKWENVVSHR